MADPTTTTSTPEGKLPVDFPNGKVEAPPKDEAAQKAVEATPEETSTTSETPSPRTYTEEELNQRIATIKGGHEGTVKELKRKIAEAQKQYQEMQDRIDEAEFNNFLKPFEEGGEHVDLAKQLIERERAARKLARELQGKKAEVDAQMELLNEAGRRKSAMDFVAQYELGKEAVESLLEASDLTGMEAKALKLYAERLKTGARPSERPPKGPTSTPKIDTSKMKMSERMGLAMENKI